MHDETSQLVRFRNERQQEVERYRRQPSKVTLERIRQLDKLIYIEGDFWGPDVFFWVGPWQPLRVASGEGPVTHTSGLGPVTRSRRFPSNGQKVALDRRNGP